MRDPVSQAAEQEQINLFLESIRQGKYAEVRPQLERYLETHPESSAAWYQLGYVFFRMNNIGRSIRALKRSIELNPENAEAHKILGLDYAALRADDGAEQHLVEAARLKPDSAEIRYFLGRIYYTRFNYMKAKDEFEKAVALDPQYLKAYDNLGLSFEALGDPKAAIENYRKSIELGLLQGSKYEWAYVNISNLYNRLNMPETALSYSERACELNPRAAQAFLEMGRSLRALQRYEGAAAALEKAIEINPAQSQYFYVLGQVYARLGRSRESREAMKKFKELERVAHAPSSQPRIDR